MCGTGALSLLGHQVFERVHIYRQTLLPCHQLCQIQRKTIGVVELECIFAGDYFLSCVLGSIAKDFDAYVERAIEAFFFTGQNGRNKVLAFFDLRESVAHLFDQNR